GYNGTSTNPNISFYSFPGFKSPPNQDLQLKWERALPRVIVKKTQDNVGTITKYSRICSLHFTENYFITKSVNLKPSVTYPLGKDLDRRYDTTKLYITKTNNLLFYRRLKANAVPSVWPNLPNYISSPPAPPRSAPASTSEKRRQLEYDCHLVMAADMFTEEKVKSAEELYEKLLNDPLPSGFLLLKTPKLSLIKLETSEDKGLQIKLSLEIDDNLTFRMFKDHHIIDNSEVSHCLSNKLLDRIEFVSAAINIAAYLGSKENLHKSIMILLRKLLEVPDLDPVQSMKLSFIWEQIKLLFKNNKSVKYSPSLLSLCLLWQNVSTALYEQIYSSNVLTIPTIKYLRALSTTLSVEARIKDLNSRERHVTLIIDEVYSAQRVEFDVVALIPVAKISAEFIYSQYNPLMKTLHQIGLIVVAISVDNHPANRSFFSKLLCGGKFLCGGKLLYLILTITQRKFTSSLILLGSKSSLCPNFAHIKDVYYKESTFQVINPTSIEKTNVKLADAVFHESTIGALKFYSREKPEFVSTAEFLEFVRTMWNILNVKTPMIGLRKRDELRKPVARDNQLGISFLKEFADFLTVWESSGEIGLTTETFLATKHTCLAVIDLAEYLLDEMKEDFSYLYLQCFKIITTDWIPSDLETIASLDESNALYQWFPTEFGSWTPNGFRALSVDPASILSKTRISISMRDICEAFVDPQVVHWTTVGNQDSILCFGIQSARVPPEGARVPLVVRVPPSFLAVEDSSFHTSVRLVAETEEEKVNLGKFINIMSRGGLSTPTDLLFLTCLYSIPFSISSSVIRTKRIDSWSLPTQELLLLRPFVQSFRKVQKLPLRL
ncbi:Putative LOC101234561, partial [Caligus rogercresseyi]